MNESFVFTLAQTLTAVRRFMKYLDEIRQKWGIQTPVIQHQGGLNQEVILKILNELERLMDGFGEKLKVTRKAFNIITECLQNIVRYADKPLAEDAQPIFVFDRQPDHYVVASGNLVTKSKADKLRHRLNELNNMDWYGIQEAYKTTIRKNMKEKDDSRDKNSAGLGFIEMARKSERKLEFIFEDYNADYSFFILGVVIPKE